MASSIAQVAPKHSMSQTAYLSPSPKGSIIAEIMSARDAESNQSALNVNQDSPTSASTGSYAVIASPRQDESREKYFLRL